MVLFITWALLSDKFYTHPENTKKMSFLQTLVKHSKKYLVFRFVSEFAYFFFLTLLYFVIERLRYSPTSSYGYNNWSLNKQAPLKTTPGMNMANFSFLLSIFLKVFAFLKWKLYLFKIILCTEINFSQLFYSRESACFSYNCYSDKAGKAYNLGGLIEFQAFNNFENTNYLKSCMIRNSGDENTTVCYWT